LPGFDGASYALQNLVNRLQHKTAGIGGKNLQKKRAVQKTVNARDFLKKIFLVFAWHQRLSSGKGENSF
jgi:hypothetical protein